MGNRIHLLSLTEQGTLTTSSTASSVRIMKNVFGSLKFGDVFSFYLPLSVCTCICHWHRMFFVPRLLSLSVKPATYVCAACSRVSFPPINITSKIWTINTEPNNIFFSYFSQHRIIRVPSAYYETLSPLTLSLSSQFQCLKPASLKLFASEHWLPLSRKLLLWDHRVSYFHCREHYEWMCVYDVKVM